MRLEQGIRKQAIGGRFAVWQRMALRLYKPGITSDRWGFGEEVRDESYDLNLNFVETQERLSEWVLVATFASYDEAVRFCNACFAARNARAPSWAGDGDGRTLSEPWISALQASNCESGIKQR